jgi:hypothetical protein
VGIRSSETPCIDPSASSPPTRRSDLAADTLARPSNPDQALGEHPHVPLVLLALDVEDLSPCLGRNAARRRAPPHRTAPAAARARPSTPEARKGPRWVTQVALILPGAKLSLVDPRSIESDEVW